MVRPEAVFPYRTLEKVRRMADVSEVFHQVIFCDLAHVPAVQNEAVILRSLKEESAGKTVVLVSHRASTMRIADVTHSVENGRLS